MSVSLLTPPADHSFSNNFITAKFFCTGFIQQQGVKAVNRMLFNVFPNTEVSLTIGYGNTTVLLSAALTPDESGSQFPADATSTSQIVPFLKKNFFLNKDFDITNTTDSIILTAKEKSLGFDISIIAKVNEDISFITTTNGIPEIKKPNYTVNFRLFLENAVHSGFDLIYSANLQLYSDQPGVAIAPIGDKIHQRITADIDKYGLEIPQLTYLECNVTCRKYYFEFAESFGENVQVQKINTSPTYNVVHGGFSFQAKTNKTLAGVISPGSPPEDRFLKQSSNQFSRADQPQFLYFYNTRETKSEAKLVVKRIFTDGSSDQVNLYYINLEQYRKYAFNVSYGNIYTGSKFLDRYEIHVADNLGARISEFQIFNITRDKKRFVRYFLNWSSWGALDSRCFTGKGQPTLNIVYEKSERVLQDGYKLISGDSKIFGKSGYESFKATTGFNDPSMIAYNKDLFLSALQFRYVSNTILPIEVTSQTIENPLDGDFLYAQTFEYRYLFSDDHYSESDARDNFSFSGSPLVPQIIQPILIVAGTPANPSVNIVQQKI